MQSLKQTLQTIQLAKAQIQMDVGAVVVEEGLMNHSDLSARFRAVQCLQMVSVDYLAFSRIWTQIVCTLFLLGFSQHN